MFGLGEAFEYVECGDCGSLRLMDVPPDMSAYYPTGYYSLGAREVPRAPRIEQALRRIRTDLLLRGGDSAVGRLALGHRSPPYWFGWLRGRVTTSSRILDFGCGSGKLLLELRRQGFRRLTGFDPFLECDIVYPGGLEIFRELQPEWGSRFDCVMLHHSFEHIADPEATLARLHDLVAPGGIVLLRTPIADSFAWRRYRTCWVQLDAPRHLFVHTRASIGLLARRTGFRVLTTRCDSRAFQFWASEQYERRIPLLDQRSYRENPANSIFSTTEIDEFERQAAALNEQGDGDQAIFVLARRS